MAKKSINYADMDDMFVQQAIDEKTASFEAAREKLEQEIRDLENFDGVNDSGLSAAENRNEINYLKEEIRYLEKKYYEDISKLKTNQK